MSAQNQNSKFTDASVNSTSDDFLSRDREQSHLLHEPNSITGRTDPITGNDIMDISGKPSIVEGNVTMYFESEETKQAYINMSKSHTLNLKDNPLEDGEAEG